MPIFYMVKQMRKVETSLRDRLASLVNAMGYEFVGCEMGRQGKGSVLRIYIDKEDGITLTDCTQVSHQVSAMLDVEDPIQEEYSLEISSPGMNRPLFEIEQYARYTGQKIKVRMCNPLNGQRNFVGMLQRVDDHDVYILVGAEEVALPFAGIEKANLLPDSDLLWGRKEGND